jgi:hypothetical protein
MDPLGGICQNAPLSEGRKRLEAEASFPYPSLPSGEERKRHLPGHRGLFVPGVCLSFS